MTARISPPQPAKRVWVITDVATNAAIYGAFSTHEGRVPLRWGLCRNAHACRIWCSHAGAALIPSIALAILCAGVNQGITLWVCALSRRRGRRTELREELNGADAARGEAAGGLAVRRPLRGARRLPDVGRQRVPRA